MKFRSPIDVDGYIALSTTNPGVIPTKFLIQDAQGRIAFRTGQELKVDIGADSTSHIEHPVKAGVAINKGQAVYVTSADGTNMIVGLASNSSEATSSKTMGLLNATVSANGFADVIAEGLLDGLNTLGATAGDPVWLGTNGNLIYGLLNKPYAPAHLVFIGIVTRVNANNGEIFVKVQNGFELDELHNVDLKTTIPLDGHILGYNGTLWVNKTIAGWLGYTPANDSNVMHLTGDETAYGNKNFPDSIYTNWLDADIINAGTSVSTYGGIYSPIYYDIYNTGYFLQPSSFSTLYGLNIIGNDASPLYLERPGSFNTNIKISNASGTLYFGSRINNSFGIGRLPDLSTHSQFTVFQSTGNVVIKNGGTPVDSGYRLDVFGTTRLQGTVYGPNFYDTDNTAYYLNPSATSNLYGLTVNQTISGNISGTAGGAVRAYYNENVEMTRTGDWVTMSTQTGISGLWHHVMNMAWSSNSQNDWVSQLAFGTQAGTGAYYRTTSGPIASASWIRILDASNYSGYSNFSGAVYGTIFYDSIDTRYYLDPASTSVLNLTQSNQFLFPSTTFNPSTGPRNTEPMSIKMWNNYFNGTGLGIDYGTVLEYYSLNGHVASQVYFDAAGGSWYRTASYNSGWQSWQKYVTENGGTWNINISGNSENAVYANSSGTSQNSDTVDGYHASDIVLYKSQTVDMSNTGVYSTSNYYPVTIPVPTSGITIEIQNNLNTNAPSWSAHGGGFTLNLKWVTNGSGWGITDVKRKVLQYHNAWTYQTICGGITQMTNGSVEVVWLRGGGIYNFKFSKDVAATAQSSTYTLYGESVSPTPSAQNTVWDSASGTENYYATTIYSGIYYDSNNTGYYIDPASTSNINAINIAGNSSLFGGYGPGYGPGLAFENQGTFARIVFWGLDFYEWDSGQIMTMNNGYVAANNSFRAPVFYDSNDTSYFFDGSSTGDSIRVAGDIIAYYSDERLKDKKGNIENALEKVLSLNGFYYEPNETAQKLGYNKKLEVGVSAQEVEAVLPEIIKSAPISNQYKTLDYGRLTPLLIEAIKEQQTQIEELKQLVNQLINK